MTLKRPKIWSMKRTARWGKTLRTRTRIWYPHPDLIPSYPRTLVPGSDTLVPSYPCTRIWYPRTLVPLCPDLIPLYHHPVSSLTSLLSLTPLLSPSTITNPSTVTLYYYPQARLGPGGLDPHEVLETLPPKMQEAFRTQNTPMLQESFTELDPLVLKSLLYHLRLYCQLLYCSLYYDVTKPSR